MPEIMTRAFAVTPATVDAEARTAELVWSTGAAVSRRDWDGAFLEILSMDPGAVDLSRLHGAALLDSHQQRELRNVLGVVTSAAIRGGKGVASVTFSARPDVEPIFIDVRSGVLRNVSVGYSVEQWAEGTDPASGARTKTAIRWTPQEISLVPVPADPGATIRSTPMEHTQQAGETAANTRATINGEIRTIIRAAGLDAAVGDGLIDSGASVEQARKTAFDAMVKRGSQPISTTTVVTGDNDNPEVRAQWMGEALFTRVNPTHAPSEPARQYVGLSLPDVGREILRLRGISTTGLAPATIITRALHTTSDFAIVLGDTVGRTLRQAYGASPAGVRQLARPTTARDFRAKQRIMLGEAPTLEKVNEAGEFTSGTMAEAAESYRADTFGRIIGISRQALVNDDLGAFTDLSRRFGLAAAEFEAGFLVDLLTSGSGNGPTMSDGAALFHADHDNKAGSGGALADTTLSAARLAMRLQTGLSGKPIDVAPKYLLVPATLETAAEKLLATIAATKTSDVNPFSGALTLVVDARLDAKSATRWYVTADPATIDGLEYCYLEGVPGPQIESRNGFEVDGVQIKVSLDYGAGFVDWRGWYVNAGA